MLPRSPLDRRKGVVFAVACAAASRRPHALSVSFVPKPRGAVREEFVLMAARATEGSKLAEVIAILRRTEGVAQGDLMATTGSLPHTARLKLVRKLSSRNCLCPSWSLCALPARRRFRIGI